MVDRQTPVRHLVTSSRASGSGQAIEAIPIAAIEPNPFQPRTRLADGAIRELAESMAAAGLVQPIIVRPHPHKPGCHQLIAGERRWRAAQLLQWETIAAQRRDADDSQMLILAYVENCQREDLTAAEEADAFRRIMADNGWSQAELARRIGKSRPYVIERLQLGAAPELKQAVNESLIPFSVAREMQRLIADGDQRRALLDQARSGGTVSLATVRAAADPVHHDATSIPPAGASGAKHLPAGPGPGHERVGHGGDGAAPDGGPASGAPVGAAATPPAGHSDPPVAVQGAAAAPRTDQLAGAGAGVGLPVWLQRSSGVIPTVDPTVNERMDYFGSDVRALVEQVRELRQRAIAQYPEIFGAGPNPASTAIRRQFAALATVLAAEGYALAEAWRQGLADDAAPTESAR